MSRRRMAADIAALQRLAAQHRAEVDRLTRERDAWAARCAEVEYTLRVWQDRADRHESDTLATLRRSNPLLRETVAALDARNDSARREIAWWESSHGACERARQMIEGASS